MAREADWSLGFLKSPMKGASKMQAFVM